MKENTITKYLKQILDYLQKKVIPNNTLALKFGERTKTKKISSKKHIQSRFYKKKTQILAFL
jgi:hypothetical protein